MDMKWLQQKVQEGQSVDWQQYGYVKATYQGDLVLFNYTAHAQYENRWNWIECVSRGLILNWKTGEIVARPFDKFFNWFQGGRKAQGHIVTITAKFDGSLGILFRQDDDYAISTRGSFPGTVEQVVDNFNSWAIENGHRELKWNEILSRQNELVNAGWMPRYSIQGTWATKHLSEWYDLWDLPNEYTLLFEIIYPDNRIVVDYGTMEELVLLAVRNRFTGEYLPFWGESSVQNLAKYYGFLTPKVYNFNSVTDIIAATDSLSADYEGWVVEFSGGQRFKFKGDRYLELHKIVTNTTFNRVLEHCQNGTYDGLICDIPDEFLVQVREHKAKIDSVVESVSLCVESAFKNAPKESRKKFALWCRENCQELMPYMFKKLDGRDYVPLVLKREF